MHWGWPLFLKRFRQLRQLDFAGCLNDPAGPSIRYASTALDCHLLFPAERAFMLMFALEPLPVGSRASCRIFFPSYPLAHPSFGR